MDLIPAPELDVTPVITHYRTESGSLVELRTVNQEVPQPPAGAVVIGPEEYADGVADIKSAYAEEVAVRKAQELSLLRAAYDHLISIGMPPAAAAAVSRYSPEA